MSGRERQLWTEFVRKREERKDEKQARKQRAKKPQPTPAELEAALDMISPTSRDLVSGRLAALVAVFERFQKARAEAAVHPHELGVFVWPLLIAGFRLRGA
jgi:hypothetical protein